MQQSDKVNQYTDAAKSCGKEVQYAHADFSFVKLVSADKAQEKAEKKCDPLILFFSSAACINIVCICVGIDIVVVNDNLRLCSVGTFVDIFHLSAA